MEQSEGTEEEKGLFQMKWLRRGSSGRCLNEKSKKMM